MHETNIGMKPYVTWYKIMLVKNTCTLLGRAPH